MKRNQVVKVFDKPVTDEDYEGNARLYRHHKQEDHDERGERWSVVFSDGSIVKRWVHARNVVV
jgi:hypothetical protein